MLTIKKRRVWLYKAEPDTQLCWIPIEQPQKLLLDILVITKSQQLIHKLVHLLNV